VPGTVQSIERAAAVLRLLAAAPDGLGVADLGNALGLAKPTVHGILRTLHQVGFVDQDHSGAHYHLSDAFGRLGESYLDPNELRSRAINWADSLASRSGEVVRVGRLVEGKVEVVHHVFRPDDTFQTLDVGTLLPLHATALGKVLLAYDTTLVASLRTGEPEAYTRRTLITQTAIKRACAKVREAGWAAENGEMISGEAGIAAPIRGHGGIVVGAIGVSGAAERICEPDGGPSPRLLGHVRDAARAVSRDLGASRW